MSTHDAHVEPWTFPLCPAPAQLGARLAGH